MVNAKYVAPDNLSTCLDLQSYIFIFNIAIKLHNTVKLSNNCIIFNPQEKKATRRKKIFRVSF